MSINRTDEYLKALVIELIKMPKEAEWLEFKHNNSNPEEIGEQVSALANSATLCDQPYAYLIWGIEDQTHKIIGTTFSYLTAKKGNEELENWLLRLLEPKQDLKFSQITIEDKSIVILEIPRTYSHPVSFQGQEFIKVGSYSKNLKNFPEKEKKLWSILNKTSFEKEVAAQNVSEDEVLKLLDYPAYFELLDEPLPSRENILEVLAADSLISRSEINKWNILNLGAILFAKNINDFKTLKRKSLRVILYKGDDRTETIREIDSSQGYAKAFDASISVINNLLPTSEVIGEAFRRNVHTYPELAIRELIANAIIHQDFTISGAGPMVEIFNERIEISNPGAPLMDSNRLLDWPPRSRNEQLASFMRRIGICEERGSGIDKVVKQTEVHHLPAPIFETIDDNTRVILFAQRPFSRMSKEDRLRACYLHACLRYVSRNFMTNASLRERLGIEAKNSAMVSRIIKDAVQAGLIRLYGPETPSKKFSKYVPTWVK